MGEQVAVVADRKGHEPLAILLIGGFGESVYSKQELGRSFASIEIQQPTKAWTAICRGAVMKGLGRQLVVNHISKYNYGVLCSQDFDEKKHLKDKAFNSTRGIWEVVQQVDWFLRRALLPLPRPRPW